MRKKTQTFEQLKLPKEDEKLKKRWVGRKGGTRNLKLSKDTMKRNLLKKG